MDASPERSSSSGPANIPMRKTASWTILGVLLLGGAAFLLSRGGPEGDPGVTTVRIVTWRPEDPAAWQEAIDRFHAAHPRVRVEQETGPNNSTQLHDLIAQKLRNRDPSVDAFLMDIVWTSEFARAGWAAPLDARLPPEARSDFYPAAIEADTVEGSLYGVPFNADCGLLYYRKDLLEKHRLAPPETWPELVERAQTIVRAEGNPDLAGYSAQLRQYEGLVCNLLEIARAAGGDLAEPDTPAVREAVAFARDRLVGEAAPRGILTYEEQESLDRFASGGAVFHRNWPYAWSVLSRGPLAGKVGLSPLPAMAPGGRRAAALGGWRFGLSAFSRRPDAAWAFVSFMTSAEIQKHFALRAGKAPARRALYADPDVLAAHPHFAFLAEALESAVARPKTPFYPRVSHVLQRALHRAIAAPGSDIAALLGEAARELDWIAEEAGR